MTEITASWICLFTPLAAVAVIALGGNRLTRRGLRPCHILSR